MRFFKSLLVALSTYSALPVPQFAWDRDNMKYAICFFPAVGLLCGAALFLWDRFAAAVGVSSVLFAAIAACIPLLLTGGIHMDGYMDTVDALASHQSRERKLEILKDPNCGAFAVIYCGIYLLCSAGLYYELYEARKIAVLCPVFLLSRALSALCAVNLPNARGSGMLCAYTQNAERRKATVSTVLTAAAACAALLWIAPVCGALAALCAGITVLLYRRLAMKQFGGVTGDTSGFFLQLCELSSMAGVWIGTMIP